MYTDYVYERAQTTYRMENHTASLFVNTNTCTISTSQVKIY